MTVKAEVGEYKDGEEKTREINVLSGRHTDVILHTKDYGLPIVRIDDLPNARSPHAQVEIQPAAFKSKKETYLIFPDGKITGKSGIIPRKLPPYFKNFSYTR